MAQDAHLVGLASAAVLPHDQEAGAGADAARDPPAVPLHKILGLAPFEGIQGACDDKSLALQALGMPPRRLLQQPGCAQKLYIFHFFIADVEQVQTVCDDKGLALPQPGSAVACAETLSCIFCSLPDCWVHA